MSHENRAPEGSAPGLEEAAQNEMEIEVEVDEGALQEPAGETRKAFRRTGGSGTKSMKFIFATR